MQTCNTWNESYFLEFFISAFLRIWIFCSQRQMAPVTSDFAPFLSKFRTKFFLFLLLFVVVGILYDDVKKFKSNRAPQSHPNPILRILLRIFIPWTYFGCWLLSGYFYLGPKWDVKKIEILFLLHLYVLDLPE